jgi:predicted dehydrogenase
MLPSKKGSKMEKIVNVGMIGSGFMGRTHSETTSKYIANAKPVAIAGGTRAPRLAQEYGVSVEKNPEALVKRKDVDAVFINTPHASHAEYTILAAENGKHVFVEKPMATTLKDCDAMIKACEKAGVNLMVGYFQRFRKSNALAKKAIDEGKIGRVFMVRETHLSVNGIKSLPKWQCLQENLGTLIGYGCHSIDKILWWIDGWNMVESVFASCGTFRENTPIETSSMVIIKFRNDVTASIWSVYECPPPGYPASGFRAWVMGMNGLLDVDGYGEIRLGTGDSWETLYVQPKVDWSTPNAMLSKTRLEAYADCGQEFIDSIIQERKPSIPGEQGRLTTEIALAAYKSSKTGQAIKLPLK